MLVVEEMERHWRAHGKRRRVEEKAAGGRGAPGPTPARLPISTFPSSTHLRAFEEVHPRKQLPTRPPRSGARKVVPTEEEEESEADEKKEQRGGRGAERGGVKSSLPFATGEKPFSVPTPSLTADPCASTPAHTHTGESLPLPVLAL